MWRRKDLKAVCMQFGKESDLKVSCFAWILCNCDIRSKSKRVSGPESSIAALCVYMCACMHVCWCVCM